MRTRGSAGDAAVTVYVVNPGPRGDPVTGTSLGALSPTAAAGPPPPTRGRRVAGLLVLLLALAGVIVVNRLSGDLVTGNPVADWPQPPAVGSCLDLDGDSPRTVPCFGPHDAEVTQAFGPLDPIVTDTSRDPMYDACFSAALDYLGASAKGGPAPGLADWYLPPLAFDDRPLEAPAGQRAGRYGWAVCVVQPYVPVRYTGTVRQVSVTDVPAAYRTCLDAGGAVVSCVLPHAQEVLAQLNVKYEWDGGGAHQPGGQRSQASPMTRAQLEATLKAALADASARSGTFFAQCMQLAATLAGTDDPSYGGMLGFGVGPLQGGPMVSGGGVTVHVGAPDPATDRPGSPSPSPSSVTVAPQACTAQAVDGRLVTGSLVGRGDTPPALSGR